MNPPNSHIPYRQLDLVSSKENTARVINNSGFKKAEVDHLKGRLLWKLKMISKAFTAIYVIATNITRKYVGWSPLLMV